MSFPQQGAPPGYGTPQPSPAPNPNPYQSSVYQPPQASPHGAPQASPYQTSTPTYGAQQQQQQPVYGPGAPVQTYGAPQYGGPQQPQKSSNSVGQMYKQAVSTGKPMFNKFSKTISSKLGSKDKQETPQHLQSYGNYQAQAQGQQSPYPVQGVNQTQNFSPQPQQGQWAGRPQGNYFPPQGQQAQTPQGQPQQQFAAQQNPSQFGNPQQQYQAGHSQHGSFSGQQMGVTPSPQTPQTMTPTSSHRMSMNIPPTVPVHPNQQQQNPSPVPSQGQPFHPNQQQPLIASPAPGQGQQFPPNQQQQSPSPAPSHPQPFTPTPPPQQYGSSPTPGTQPNNAQQQQTPLQKLQQHAQAQLHHTNQLHQQQQQQHQQQMQQQPQLQQQQVPQQQMNQQQQHAPQQQQHGNVSPLISPTQLVAPAQTSGKPPPAQSDSIQHPPAQVEHPIQPSQQPHGPQRIQGHQQAQIDQHRHAPQQTQSPPPPQSSGNQHPAHQAPQPVQQNQPHPQLQQSPSSSQPGIGPTQSAPTAFVAELPADMGSLNLSDDSKARQSPSNAQTSPYHIYHHAPGQGSSPAQGFAIPRRAISTSSMPLADPWRIADLATELPTREFFILADLLFDALDRKYEPRNTGLIEASKVLESWKCQELPNEVAQLFAHDTYTAFAKLWSLEGIPHIMVPCQPNLTPLWDFQEQAHSQNITVPKDFPAPGAPYPSYIPALNRAGWYKSLFLEAIAEPGTLDKLVGLFCGETYRPGVMRHPDLGKMDRTENAGLAERARGVRTVLQRVCQEMAAMMQAAQQQPQQQPQCQGQSQAMPQGQSQ